MLILRKRTFINLILTAMLRTATAVYAEAVEYDGLFEPYVIVEIGAPVEGIVATVTIVDKVIDAASSTFGVRLELPNAKQQMPSGLRCVVRFDIDPYGDQMKKVTARNYNDQIQR